MTTITEKILSAAKFDEERADQLNDVVLGAAERKSYLYGARWQSDERLILVYKLAKIIEEQNKALENIKFRCMEDTRKANGSCYLMAKEATASVNQQLALLEGK